jgi:hypothetical protein
MILADRKKIFYHAVLLSCIILASVLWSGCNKKVGVKPGGQLKTRTDKCKCKKKKGVYSDVIEGKITFQHINQYKLQHHSNA